MIHSFNYRGEKFLTLDKIPDFRSDLEKENPLLSVYNHDKSDLALAERYAEEMVNISGGPVIAYSRQIVEHAEGTIQALWEEEVERCYNGGIWLKAVYKQDPLNIVMTRYGVDSPLKINCNFSRAVLLKTLGEKLIRIGDVLRVPYNIVGKEHNHYFEVVNCFDSGNYQFRWLYWTCVCQLLYNDDTIRPFLEYDKQQGWL